MKRHLTTAALLLALLIVACPARGDGFKALGKELAKAARKAGMGKVVVVSFVPADDSNAKDGWFLAEKLTTQVVRSGAVQAVERSMIEKLMDEHRLARTGVLDQSSIKKLGRVAAADGVITGSFVTLGTKVAVHARLIDVETGVIVAAAERDVDRAWFETAAAVAARRHLSWPLEAERPADVSVWPEVEASGLRDSVSDDSCQDVDSRVDSLNREILDLKARYWALKLREGLSLATLKHDPGSEITDPRLRKEFRELMEGWSGRSKIPRLTVYEIKRFVHLDSKAFGLHRRCRV